jgi:hypothetical protein
MDSRRPPLPTLLEAVLFRNTVLDDFEVEHDFPGIGRKAMLLNAHIDPLTEGEMQGRPRRARGKKRAAILGEVFSVRVGWIIITRHFG